MISDDPKTRRFCSEPLSHIENYGQAIADAEHVWDCHHRGEILPCGRYTVAQLQKHGLYWHRPASELIFLRHDVHSSLHHKGKIIREETKRKLSKYFKGKRLSDEAKRNMSEASTLKKKVEMTRLSDGFTMTFPSMQAAVRYLRENGFPKALNANISTCSRGIRRSVYGAKWRIVNGPV